MRVGILLVLLAGCAAPGGPLAEAAPFAVLSFDADGRSEAVEANGAALWAIADPDVCFALEHAARGAALDVIEGGAARYQHVRCATGTPLREARADALQLFAVPAAPSPGRLRLRFVLTERSALVGDAARQEAVIAALETELGPVGITPALVEVVEVTGAPAESRFADLEPEALEALLSLAPPPPAGTVDVVFAGCLRRIDALGTPSAVLGFTGRVGGGGGGAADAVFLPGLRCDAFEETPAPVDAERMAHVLAHELGHFLGLAHVDDATNAMHPNPELAGARGFTDAQARRMRRHPFARP